MHDFTLMLLEDARKAQIREFAILSGKLSLRRGAAPFGQQQRYA